MTESRERDRFRAVLEVIATVVLSAATVLTAWSAFESTKWGGLQSINFSRASATRTESLRASTAAGQQETVDVGTFTAWLEATDQDQTRLASLIEDRFSLSLMAAFTQWQAKSPLTDSAGPATPFDLPSYQSQERQQAADLETAASAEFKEATVDNQRADNYVLMTVLFSITLFFDAVSARLTDPRSRYPMITVALVVFVIATVITATFPIHF